MTPGSMPLALYRGDSYHWRIAVWTDAAKTTPADLTGVTVAAEIRNAPNGADIVALDCTVEVPNVITVDLTATASATVPAKGQWDLQLTYPDGDVATLLAGSVTVVADVTGSPVTPATRTTVTLDLAQRAAAQRA